MRLLKILLLVVSSLCGVAQPALNKVYGSETGNIGGSIIKEKNGYLISGNGFDEQYSDTPWLYSALKFLRVDSLGNLLWERDYGKYKNGYQEGVAGGSCKKTIDGGYIVPGSFRDSTTGICTGIILRIDSVGDSLWEHTFTLGNFTQFNDCLETPDKGFIAVGQTTGLENSTGDIYLVKLDSSGNLLWQRTYGNDQEDAGLSIAILPDGGLLIGAIATILAPQYVNNYLIRTDSTGNTIWTRMYGITKGENGGCEAFPAENGGYLMFGLWDTLNSDGIDGASYIAKLDTAGNIKWMAFFDDSISTDKVRQLPNGDIITVGQKKLPSGQGYYYGGYISKLDSNGTELWENLFLYNGPFLDSSYKMQEIGAFYDVQPTNDNGFAITGTANFVDTFVQNYQAIWLVKTDSNGCIDSYCGIEGIEEINQTHAQTNLKIYPNPAYSNVTIEWQPNGNHSTTIVIYDMLGRAIESIAVDEGMGVAQLDISGLANGMYVVKLLSAEGSIGGGKLGVVR